MVACAPRWAARRPRRPQGASRPAHDYDAWRAYDLQEPRVRRGGRSSMRAAIVTALTVGILLGVPGVSVAQEELSTTDRLDQRRYVAAGDEAYVMGFQDGSF